MVAFALADIETGDVADRLRTVEAAENLTEGTAVDENGYEVDPTDTTRVNILGILIADADLGETAVYVGLGDTIKFSNTLTARRTLVVVAGGLADYEENLPSGSRYVRIGTTTATNELRVDPLDLGVSAL